jgi:hybrid polyketide synthase/nonribosomal peptide synthetase ACE1
MSISVNDANSDVASDPVEAEAVSRAFFDGKHSDGKPETGKDRLYVGSIKTVLGHTEGYV